MNRSLLTITHASGLRQCVADINRSLLTLARASGLRRPEFQCAADIGSYQQVIEVIATLRYAEVSKETYLYGKRGRKRGLFQLAYLRYADVHRALLPYK